MMTNDLCIGLWVGILFGLLSGKIIDLLYSKGFLKAWGEDDEE